MVKTQEEDRDRNDPNTMNSLPSVGNGFTVNTPASEFDEAMPIVRQIYEDRDRNDPNTWQTVHSVVYDILQRKLFVIVQEDGIELVYKLNNNSRRNMMYRIMEVKKYKENYGSLYSYMTETTPLGEVKPIEIETDSELDKFVEDLLNNKGYSKDDFIIINVTDYEIDAKISEDI